ncbi:unnamed protein product [Didymodactylos carnosus]|uniref:HID1 n=1 Tax=Didymodactylos carnosus TaxID=1234261 RepID=A0A813UWB5_9BILA|nr:unnamed protein product [Didymodactylos carnosus]CAF0828955.1 unnamed protein product [Didymodactylos carnosus]CAF3536325.1 unnamed protein product [Didymodactylos carnosus]CAF3615957.1 unnamed protein product [Didymodactylos carnosus]
MGNTDSKVDFRVAVVQLTSRSQQIEDESFWDQFWSDKISSVQDIFALIPAAEIRALREETPSNLATLCIKVVDRLVLAAEHSCQTQRDQVAAINCVRLLTRLLPYIFEEPEWRGFFWSDIPNKQPQNARNESGDFSSSQPLAERLLQTLSDLLFCPDFTVASKKKKGPENPEDIHTIDSCEYIWEAGVGFAHSPTHYPQNDRNRAEILKLLLTCFSEAIYMAPSIDLHLQPNKWLTYFTSGNNRQTLPLFTSLLNIVFSYDPVGYLPYNYLLFTDTREPLVEVAAQLLCIALDNTAFSDGNISSNADYMSSTTTKTIVSPNNQNISNSLNSTSSSSEDCANLFVNYLSRIHRDEDFAFLLKGFCRLLNNPLIQTYLPGSCKKIGFHQELLILFWKFCDRNKKFLYYVLKSSEVLDILVPILYYLNDARSDSSKVGLMHIGVFILLLLSGERNFGVRLNKPYQTRVPMDIPVFTGTHADFLIIAFSSPWFLFSASDNHHLVFFLLEAFNNLIQYQFDGNANLVYTVIRKRQIFFSLSNLATDSHSISKLCSKSVTNSGGGTNITSKKDSQSSQQALGTTISVFSPSRSSFTSDGESISKEQQTTTAAGSNNSNAMTTTLAETPSIHKMTERTLAASSSFDQPSPSSSPNEKQRTSSTTNGSSNENITSLLNNKTDNRVLDHSRTSSPLSVVSREGSVSMEWTPTPEWAQSWKQKLPLQTIMRLLQVLVPQVEKICMDRGLTDESEIIKFLQHGTLVGLLPVPHPILIRKYQPNSGTVMWFRTYMWGVVYLRNVDPPIWYDTDVKLFEIQRA